MDVTQVSNEQWDELSRAKVNGRQIKNAVRSCQGLALSRGRPVSFELVKEVLGVMEQFERDFELEKGGNHDEDRCACKKEERLDQTTRGSSVDLIED